MTKKLTSYDPPAALENEESIALFKAEAFEMSDVGDGMSEIARNTRPSREKLCRTFSENGNPTLRTTLAVMKAVGIDLTAKVHV